MPGSHALTPLSARYATTASGPVPITRRASSTSETSCAVHEPFDQVASATCPPPVYEAAARTEPLVVSIVRYDTLPAATPTPPEPNGSSDVVVPAGASRSAVPSSEPSSAWAATVSAAGRSPSALTTSAEPPGRNDEPICTGIAAVPCHGTAATE